MKIATQDSTKSRRSRSTEAVILFCIGTQTFAIAADAVQEIRSTDSLATAAIEMELAEVPKVRHLVERSHRTYGRRLERPRAPSSFSRRRAPVVSRPYLHRRPRDPGHQA